MSSRKKKARAINQKLKKFEREYEIVLGKKAHLLPRIEADEYYLDEFDETFSELTKAKEKIERAIEDLNQRKERLEEQIVEASSKLKGVRKTLDPMKAEFADLEQRETILKKTISNLKESLPGAKELARGRELDRAARVHKDDEGVDVEGGEESNKEVGKKVDQYDNDRLASLGNKMQPSGRRMSKPFLPWKGR